MKLAIFMIDGGGMLLAAMMVSYLPKLKSRKCSASLLYLYHAYVLFFKSVGIV